MTFASLLYRTHDQRDGAQTSLPPAFFADLNCDQIVDAVTRPKAEYDLKPFFYDPLRDTDAVRSRQEVIRDLENPVLHDHVTSFARNMQKVRGNLERMQKLYCKEQRQSWFLETVELYRKAVSDLARNLTDTELRSSGLSAFRDDLSEYVRSDAFRTLVSEIGNLRTGLANVQYCVLIKGGGFTVYKYTSESNYSSAVEQTFSKFKQSTVPDYRVPFQSDRDMNHIEAKVLEFVALLHPEVFVPLSAFCETHVGFIDDAVSAFDREIQFFLAYLDYIAPLKKAGLPFCYPRVVDDSKHVYDYDGFDLALAQKCVSAQSTLVLNDFELSNQERILVVSGPNQGGKTTYARAFGQLHYLASLGLPIPGRAAQLFLFDRLFTHFEKEERVETLRGKLEDDLVRIRAILDRATPRSIVVMNEIFTSTTLQDEIRLSAKIMEQLIALGLLCVWVTFVDEMASFGPQTVSMVSTVADDDPAQRTFKIVRRPADGRAYAMAIATKHRLTYQSITERIQP